MAIVPRFIRRSCAGAEQGKSRRRKTPTAVEWGRQRQIDGRKSTGREAQQAEAVRDRQEGGVNLATSPDFQECLGRSA
jgi:hypothetical protein